MMSHMFILMLALVSIFAGCSQEEIGGLNQEETYGLNQEALMNPKSEVMNQQAPDEFEALFETSAGNFTIKVERKQAPQGADRFYNLVLNGFYDEQRFFRVVPGFVVQWGMHGDPQVIAQWQKAQIQDDPVNASNVRGTICFAATQMPNSRTTQVFINLGDNVNLDTMRFAPFGKVTGGIEVVDAINPEYGQQPDQGKIATRGNDYLKEKFPELDYIIKAQIVD